MKHRGKCYQNTKIGPACSEEYAALEAGRRLLLDDTGAYRGDNFAVFLDIVVSNNDVRAPAKLIKEQHGIISSVVDKIAEHIPDIGHVIKVYNNELYRIREKDPSFRGATLLANDRIRVIMSDVLSSFVEYKPHIGDKKTRLLCLKRINAVITHHCGDHSRYKWEEVCGYQKSERE